MTAKGLCPGHYRRSKLGLPLDVPLRSQVGGPGRGYQGAPCSTDGCDRPADSAGLCERHYQAAYAKARNEAGLPTCAHPGCEAAADGSRGLCHAHYARTIRGVELDAPMRRKTRYNGQICVRDGCDEPASSNWLCKRHDTSMNNHRRLGAPGFATPAQLDARFAVFGNQCFICAGPAQAIEHVKPIAKGGSNWPSNLRPVCQPCNSTKHDHWLGVARLGELIDWVQSRRLEKMYLTGDGELPGVAPGDTPVSIRARRSRLIGRPIPALAPPKPPCGVDGCEEPHSAKGLCAFHYRRHRKGIPLDLPVRGERPERSCVVNGCDKTVVAKDLCSGHYQRLQRHGDPVYVRRKAEKPERQDRPPRAFKPPKETAPKVPCRAPGCEHSDIKGDGCCSMHYQRLRRWGALEPKPKVTPIRNRDKVCALGGCERPVYALDLCEAHHRRRRLGKPLEGPVRERIAGKLQGATCSLDGCARPAYAKGMCRSCYSSVTRRQKQAQAAEGSNLGAAGDAR